MNKWTPIKEGLPPVGVPLVVSTVNSFPDMTNTKNEVKYPVYYRKGIFNGKWGFYLHCFGEENILLPDYSEVVAWMEIPSFYESEVDND